MTQTIRTCLWFERDAEAAVAFYTSLIPGSRIEQVYRTAPNAPAMLIEFHLGGVAYSALQAEGGPAPSPAASILVNFASQAAADAAYDAILDQGGTELQCGWLTDAWGISWQIVPPGMNDVLFGGSPAANQAAFQTMSTMKRLNPNAIAATLPAA